jgi:hypothetical protein
VRSFTTVSTRSVAALGSWTSEDLLRRFEESLEGALRALAHPFNVSSLECCREFSFIKLLLNLLWESAIKLLTGEASLAWLAIISNTHAPQRCILQTKETLLRIILQAVTTKQMHFRALYHLFKGAVIVATLTLNERPVSVATCSIQLLRC